MHLGDTSITDLARLAMARWETDLAALGGPDELLHLELSSPRLLDLGTAHPSGLAAFLAGRATRLSEMFRAPESLAVARTHAQALALAAQRLEEVYGLPGAQLATGVLDWRDAPGGPVLAPVLLRPLRLVPRGADVTLDYDLEPGDLAYVNPALVDLLAAAGVKVEDRPVNDPDHGAAARRALDRLAASIGPLEARLLDRTLGGTFTDYGSGLVATLRRRGDDILGHRTVRALLRRPSDVATEPDPVAAQTGSPGPGPGPVQGGRAGNLNWQITATEPAPARAGGQSARASLLDPSQRQVLAAVEAGGDLRVEAAPGSGVTTTLAAIADSCLSQGRQLLIVAPTRAELTGVQAALADGTAVAERARVEARGRAAHAALHRVHEQWGLSRMQVLSRLRALGVSSTGVAGAATRAAAANPPAPLTGDALTGLAEGRAGAILLLEEAGDAGTFTAVASGSPWAGAAVPDDPAAQAALATVREVLESDLPVARTLMAQTSEAAGLPPGLSLTEWTAHIEVLGSVRGTLDLMRPEVYERVGEEMVVATASSNWRTSNGVTMSLLDRRRWKKEATALVRPGLAPADLHASLKRARLEQDLWARLGGAGIPSVPPTIDQASQACRRVREAIEKLEPVLAPAAVGGGLADLSIDELTERLQRLSAAGSDLTNLPRRAELATELDALGLTGLVEHLRRVGATRRDVATALETAWLRGVLAEMENVREASAESFPTPAGLAALAESVTTSTAVGLGQLDPGEDFDVVVLVDAHRIGLAEAVLALSRGRQSVLIGDPAGLPPLWLDLGEEQGRRPARVSVLAGAAGLLPTQRLDRIHRQPDRLAVLSGEMGAPEGVQPQWSVAAADGREVGLFHVPGGTVASAEEGETIPAQEVEAVVALIAEHARTLPGESLAVLTVGRGMAQSVAEVLRAALRRSPELAGWLTASTPEPFAVSDLGHADHIVRDHVVLALGLARDSLGRFEHRFGALDTPAGSQLLTLGVGQARRRVSVVSSLYEADLDAAWLETDGSRRVARLLAAAQAGEEIEPSGPPSVVDLRDGAQAEQPPAPAAVRTEPAPDLDPVLASLAGELERAGAGVLAAQRPDREPDLAVGYRDRRIAVLWDGEAGYGHRADLAAALTRFGWTVRRVQAVQVAADPARVAATVLS